MSTRDHGKAATRLGGAVLILAASALGCGGGDTFLLLDLQVRFQGFLDPTPGTVTLVEGMLSDSSENGTVLVDVVVTDTDGIRGVDFDLLYDSAHFVLEHSYPGQFLNEGGMVQTRLDVQVVPEGPAVARIIVGHERVGVTTPDIRAVGPQVLLSLEFGSVSSEQVTSPVVFDDSIEPPRVRSTDGTIVVPPEDFHGGELYLELTP